jgi:hypothetical protein
MRDIDNFDQAKSFLLLKQFLLLYSIIIIINILSKNKKVYLLYLKMNTN